MCNIGMSFLLLHTGCFVFKSTPQIHNPLTHKSENEKLCFKKYFKLYLSNISLASVDLGLVSDSGASDCQKTCRASHKRSTLDFFFYLFLIKAKFRGAKCPIGSNAPAVLVRSTNAVMPQPGGPGGPLAPPIFGRLVNPIPTGEGRLSPPITTGTPNFFHLPASLE